MKTEGTQYTHLYSSEALFGFVKMRPAEARLGEWQLYKRTQKGACSVSGLFVPYSFVQRQHSSREVDKEKWRDGDACTNRDE